ncbi:sigma-E processing peptidase SpoIIGA [Sediminibacillus halophilus]|uniref:Sporulation sigma-E factor-processing peptidase n=1 Tax=Sediminibacillus halophilus TaxID=482461 RepID=A0A1G9MR32_9BACI|nr:sigma-E processing peptidase SpoIIGA [Sediminibacillus halophilus]SDL76564.1 stage II sporulation protein GA (sporulation sigma-E factor processing peptidase) [Sediminibacillus halophilus]
MTIYLDAVWLLNFMLDWMILLLTHYVAKKPHNRLRLILGAFVASILVPLTIYYPDSFLSAWWGKGLYSLLIVWTAFGWYNASSFRNCLVWFYFVSFILGGSLIALHFLIGQQVLASSSGLLTFKTGFGDQVSWLFVLIGFPCVWWFTKNRMDKHAFEKLQLDHIFSISLTFRGKRISAKGYMDSGNSLVDPVTKEPVIICEQSLLLHWFSEEELAAFQEVQENLQLEKLPQAWEDKIRLVPYQGVGGRSTFMLVFRPDLIETYYENKQIVTSRILIGMQFGSLATDGSYHCLLHPGILKYSTATSA